jgi:hypothetical protein
MDQWIAYFVYAPDGAIGPSHRFTVDRLRQSNAALLVVMACPDASLIPAEISQHADAVVWKGLSGYDFSAYSLALWHLAERSPGSNVCVLNDSVFGPFHDISSHIESPKWDVTGYTASSLVQNHIQSYAFVIRDVTVARMQQLSRVFPVDFAFDRAGDVILCQELAFGAVASRHMSVGSHWFGEVPAVEDPTLQRPTELLAAGFPFIKKSVFGKQWRFQQHNREELVRLLQSRGHPAP